MDGQRSNPGTSRRFARLDLRDPPRRPQAWRLPRHRLIMSKALVASGRLALSEGVRQRVLLSLALGILVVLSVSTSCALADEAQEAPVQSSPSTPISEKSPSQPSSTSAASEEAPPPSPTVPASKEPQQAPPPAEETLQTSTSPPPAEETLQTSTSPPPAEETLQTSTSPPPAEETLQTSTSPPPAEETLQTSTSPPPAEETLQTSTSPPPAEETLQTSTSPPPAEETLQTSTSPPPAEETSTTTTPVSEKVLADLPSSSTESIQTTTGSEVGAGEAPLDPPSPGLKPQTVAAAIASPEEEASASIVTGAGAKRPPLAPSSQSAAGGSKCDLSGLAEPMTSNCTAEWLNTQSLSTSPALSLAGPMISAITASAGTLATPNHGSSFVGGRQPDGPGPGPGPAPSGVSGGAAAGGSGVAFSGFVTLAGLLLLAAPRALRRLRLSFRPWLTAFFVLIPERPG